jgi:hypothetical protein
MKKAYLTFLFLLLLTGLFVSQYFFDQGKRKTPLSQPLVLKPQIVKAIDLGLHNAASDFAWLSSIQYFGGRSSYNSPKLPDYLFLSAGLDPKFSYPYAFGALILPTIGQVDEGIELAKKGIAEADPDWRIPYYLATTYHINRKDSKNAAYYFDVAGNTKGAPDNIRKVAARYGSRADQREQTKQIWLGIYESSHDEVVKERAKKYVLHFEILTFLEEAVKEYKTRFGKYPEKIDDLVSSNILKKIPEDPFGFQYTVEESGRVSPK